MRTIFLSISTLAFAFTMAMLTFLTWKRWEMRTGLPQRDYMYRAHSQFKPSPRLSAEQVTDLQLAALKYNDARDQGIRKAFEFVGIDSSNQREEHFRHFRNMLRSDNFKPILNYRKASKSPVNYYNNNAFRIVTVDSGDGRQITYLFELEFQTSGKHLNCWLTKTVRKLDERSPFAMI